MAKLNTLNLNFPPRTHEGAPARNISTELQLRRSVMACLLWESQFYEDGVEIAGRIAADEYRHYKLFYDILGAQTEPDLGFWKKLKIALGRVQESDTAAAAGAAVSPSTPTMTNTSLGPRMLSKTTPR